MHENGIYRVKKSIRDIVVFAVQSMIKDPPFSRLDLISCRNVMIYMDATLQQRLLQLFHYALVPGGYLHLGTAETIGDATDLFATVDRKWKLYRARETVLRTQPMLHHMRMPGAMLPATWRARRNWISRTRRPGHAARTGGTRAARGLAPPAVIVNEKGDVLYIHGRIGRYLEPASGEASLNITALARDGLRFELMKRAAQGGGAEDRGALRTPAGARQRRHACRHHHRASRCPKRPTPTGCCWSPSKSRNRCRRWNRRPQRRSRCHTDAAAELEQELRLTREYLQATDRGAGHDQRGPALLERRAAILERGTAVDQRGAGNLEGRAAVGQRGTGDGQRRTGDESRPALESQQRPEQSAGHTEIGTIFLNHELRIQRFTPATLRFVNLMPHDVGPAAGARRDQPRITPTLVLDARAVLETLAPRLTRSADGGRPLVLCAPPALPHGGQRGGRGGDHPRPTSPSSATRRIRRR